MPYCRLYYHIIWGTKYREPTITPEIEPVLYNFIRSKAIGLGGFLHALNGTEDYVHLIVSIPETMPLAQFNGKIRGSSSTKINKSGLGDDHFYWQTGYSAFTIKKKPVPVYIKYVANQKHHHQEGTMNSQLEMKDLDL